MTRDSTALPPVGEPPEAGSTTTQPDPALDAVQVSVPTSAESPPTDPGPAAIAGHPPEIDPRKLDPDALKVVYRLRQFGHEAYFVGGCVRDLLLGLAPKDFDIATSAHPGEVRAIFRNCRLIGRRFRLAHVYFKGGKIIEVATFRANPTEVEEAQAQLELPPPPEKVEPIVPVDALLLGAEDGGEEGDDDATDEAEETIGGVPLAESAADGTPDEAEAAEEPEAAPEADDDLLITHDNVFGTAEQDARRRDFRMNGLFYDVEYGEVIDYVGGRRDLRERLIRTIGDPEVRMREDPVRILRAVRFACKLGLDLEGRTYAAMEGAVEDLPRCAPPRLLEETFRLIRGGISTDALKLVDALGALGILLPPVAQFFKERGKEGEEQFYAFTRALDRRIGSGAQLEDAILLAVLLYPIARGAPVPEETPEQPGRPMVPRVVEELLEELVKNSRLPRRIAERTRMLLIAQRTLSGERKRRGSLQSFRRHPLFKEALTVFETIVDATGEHREALEKWKEGGAPEAQAGAEAGAPRRRRRRRRGGAGRGRGSDGEGAAEAAAPGGDD